MEIKNQTLGKEIQIVLFLNNQNVTEQIRSTKVTENVSEVSALKTVRKFMVNIQRQMAKDYDCILEGRDIGTVVYPNADFKFFLVADERSRANRRLNDLRNAGMSESLNIDNVLRDLNNRDHKDSTRKHSFY